MKYIPKTIRTFIGAKDYQKSRAFYRDLDFAEVVISGKMCLLRVNENSGFYLQDYYVEEWINNSMVFLEVDDLDKCAEDLLSKNLRSKYPEVKVSEIKHFNWGRELFLHDPSGVLWHFCEFTK